MILVMAAAVPLSPGRSGAAGKLMKKVAPDPGFASAHKRQHGLQ